MTKPSERIRKRAEEPKPDSDCPECSGRGYQFVHSDKNTSTTACHCLFRRLTPDEYEAAQSVTEEELLAAKAQGERDARAEPPERVQVRGYKGKYSLHFNRRDLEKLSSLSEYAETTDYDLSLSVLNQIAAMMSGHSLVEAVPAEPEPTERGDGDAPYRLAGPAFFTRETPDGIDQCELHDGKWIEFYMESDVEKERARHAEEVARLKNIAERLKMEAQIHAQEARAANGTIREIYQVVTRATGEPGSWEGAGPVRARIAELEAETSELRERLDALQADYDNLAGDELPGVGVDPKDSSRLSDLRSLIDDVGTWPSEEAEDAGDYEVAIRHMAEMCRERSCMFSEVVKVDVHDGQFITVPGWRRFIGHHCRFTVEALYPIGPPAEVSKPEGRDS